MSGLFLGERKLAHIPDTNTGLPAKTIKLWKICKCSPEYIRCEGTFDYL
jgi:hypothetical protein